MKNFLHRTLESARGVEQRVKPLAGSVYAGDRRRQVVDTRGWGEESAYAPLVPNQTSPFRAPSQPEAVRPVVPSTQDVLLPAQSESHEKPAISGALRAGDLAVPAGSDSSAAPFAEHADRHSAMQSSAEKNSLQNVAPLTAPKGRRSALPPASQPNGVTQRKQDESQRREEVSRAEKSLPIPEPRRAEATPRVEPLLRPALAAKASIAPQLSLPKNRVTQEAAPVQIHIGRVEVIATAPQAPKTPTPRPNRATSLADYLAGRNGRSS